MKILNYNKRWDDNIIFLDHIINCLVYTILINKNIPKQTVNYRLYIIHTFHYSKVNYLH